MNATPLEPGDFAKAIAALKDMVNAPGRGESPGIFFFDGAWYRRDPASGDWLPVARP